MRLTCPSCGAQYEVPSEAIPPTGRDVQCSNCGHGWFEVGQSVAAAAGSEDDPEPTATEDRPAYGGPTAEAPEVEDDDEEALDLAEIEAGGGVGPPVAPEPLEPPGASGPSGRRDEAFGSSRPALWDSSIDEAEPRAPLGGPPARPPGSSVTPAVAAILRAEAAREAAAREVDRVPDHEPRPEAAGGPGEDGGLAPALAVEPPPLAPPPPPLAEAERERAEEARRRMARFRAGASTGLQGGPQGTPASALAPTRRDRLPDVAEINSTLRPSASRVRAQEAPPRRSRGWGGLTLALLVLVALVVGLYVAAPRIVAAVPAAGPVLAPYVDAVDASRAWLDQRLGDDGAPEAP